MITAKLIDGEQRETALTVVEGHGETALSALRGLQAKMRRWPGPMHLLRKETRIAQPLPGRDYLGDLRQSDEPLEDIGAIVDGHVSWDGDALVLKDQTNRSTLLAMWHQPIIYGIRLTAGRDGPQTVELTYESDPRAPKLNSKIASSPKFMGATHEYYLEWRGYFGANSGLVDGFVRLVKAGKRRITRLTFQGTGFVTAKILRVSRWAQPEKALGPRVAGLLLRSGLKQREDFTGLNLREMPDLLPGSDVGKRCTVVLVHGTLSSAGGAFKYLDPDRKIFDTRWVELRVFEHDTFQSIESNASELRDLIVAKIRCARLLLIGHSRGGLVARLAGHYLGLRQYAAQVEAFTYGTPHFGTPLVNEGSALLRGFALAGSGLTGAIPIPPVSVGLVSYLLSQVMQMPKGVSDMHPESSLIGFMTNSRIFADATTSYAGSFDPAQASTAGLSFLGGFSAGSMDEPNDGVVPVASALGKGVISTTTPEIEGCSHFEFFGRDVGGQVEVGCASWVRQCKTDAGQELAAKRLQILRAGARAKVLKLKPNKE